MHAEIRRPDGTTIAYDVAGSGPPALFLHGLTNSRRAWDPIVERLAGELTCVRLDLRGHGESSRAPEYGLPSLVADVRAVAEELALEEPALVGHSLGATVAALYAAAHGAGPVVAIDQSLRFGDFAERIRPLAGRLLGDGFVEAMLEFERGLDIGPYAGADGLERRIRDFPPEIVRGLWAAALTTPPEELTALAEGILPRIAGPLLALHGSPPPPGYARWLTALVPRAEVEVWDGAGHFLHLVEPDRFAVRVRGFLASAADRRRGL